MESLEDRIKKLEARIAELEPMATGEYFKHGVSRMQLEVERAKVENARLHEDYRIQNDAIVKLQDKLKETRLVLRRARDEFVRLGWSKSEGGIIATIDETLKDE